MIRAALFDLDGTPTESGPGITRSVAYSLRKFGISEPDQKKLDRFVGPPLIDSYMRYYGFSYEQAKQAVVYYREYYETKGLFENRVYDGVEDGIERVSRFVMPFIALLSTILIGWIKTPDYVIGEMERNGEHFRRKSVYRVMIRYIAPVMMLILFLQSTGILS